MQSFGLGNATRGPRFHIFKRIIATRTGQLHRRNIAVVELQKKRVFAVRTTGGNWKPADALDRNRAVRVASYGCHYWASFGGFGALRSAHFSRQAGQAIIQRIGPSGGSKYASGPPQIEQGIRESGGASVSNSSEIFTRFMGSNLRFDLSGLLVIFWVLERSHLKGARRAAPLGRRRRRRRPGSIACGCEAWGLSRGRAVRLPGARNTLGRPGRRRGFLRGSSGSGGECYSLDT